MEAATSSYSATGKFFAICLFYACRQEPSEDPIKVFSSWIFLHRYFLTIRALLKKNSLWLLSIYMDVASYCYYEKGRRTNARSLSIFILFQLQSWIILRVRTMFLLRNYHAKRLIFEIAMMNIFNNCIAGSLNNNYFPLNESSSLY